MTLNEDDIKIIEQIILLEGKCIKSTRCSKCPFRKSCLPEFLNPSPPGPNQRAKIAIDILTNYILMGEAIEVQDYKWDKK